MFKKPAIFTNGRSLNYKYNLYNITNFNDIHFLYVWLQQVAPL